ncbi:MAG: CusA/CzcA family heavy metal efflux RND transporter [Thermoanaerobaculia bacterium]|nr:CusA/CzcA family heavy metal efflux RND transporter [Thermoanaerobaculia bacterium]
MLSRLIEASLRHRGTTLLALAAVMAGGWWAALHTRVDAIPDLSDTQVIVYTEVPGQGPRVVEDQVTYPITTKMLSVPGAEAVRGYSYFGVSFVYVIFEEGTDLYWARSRVLEYLSTLQSLLPRGVSPQLGPDATGVGWAYMYALNSDRHSLDELRSIQDWYLRYGLTSIDGVAEVSTFGGFVRQFQVEVDPLKMRAYGVSLARVKDAIRRSNNDVGGRLLEMGEREVMVRGRGYASGVSDLEQIALGVGERGTPILLRDVAHITVGPELRRGVAEWNGEGETVGGIVVVRDGADVRQTLERVESRLAELRAGLPEGVTLEKGYDRRELIEGSLETLTRTLVEESIIVAAVCMIFLFHVRSAFVAILSIPVSILASFLILHVQGLFGSEVGANIMSLGGIAISIGVLVDAAVVMVENAHKHHERWRGRRSQFEIILRSAQEVGPTLFFTLLVITVSFLPIFTLEAQEGKLFRPLAFTKTWAMAASSLVAVTLIPVLTYYLVRGRIHGEETHPVSRLLRALYRPLLRFSLRRRATVLIVAGLLMLSLVIPLSDLGSEFMPPLWEGDLLYMPTTFPGVSITKAKELLQQTDKLIAQFPEVESVLGKIGRADTATDPAPLSMIETTIQLKPRSEWREGLTKEALIRELDRAVNFPGLTNSWTMPIRTRIDMLSTGIRTPVGIKLAGPDLAVLEMLAEKVEAAVRELPGTASAYAERVTGGLFLDIEVDRRAIARYGLTVGDVQDVVQSAVGGMNVSWIVDGRERYPINVRYPRELRDDLEALGQVLVDAPGGVEIPLGRLAELKLVDGPPMIKSENAVPNAWIYVDLQDAGPRGVDLGSWVAEAREEIGRTIDLPEGYSIAWSGQWESMERVRRSLSLVVPITLGLIALILAYATRSAVKTAMVFLTVPMSLVGAFWLVHLLDFNLSVAVWVGVIALAGLDAEMGVVMLLYLDLAFDRWRRDGRMTSLNHLAEAVEHGAVQRIRPKLMTVTTTFCALVPILWATGTGADVMRRIAAPMVGGVVTSFVGELVVFPALYFIWRSRQIRRGTLPPLSLVEAEPNGSDLAST